MSGIYRDGSSPPSPVLLLAWIRFIAIAIVSWASRLIDPRDIAPVANRFTISDAGSTSSKEIGLSNSLKPSRPRIVLNRLFSLSAKSANCSYVAQLLDFTACWRAVIVLGFHIWNSPSRRHR